MTVRAPVSKLPDTGTTIFTVMSRLAEQHSAVNLSQGFPDFDPPARLIELVADALAHGRNQYAPMAGVTGLREAIAVGVAERFGSSVLSADRDHDYERRDGGVVLRHHRARTSRR